MTFGPPNQETLDRMIKRRNEIEGCAKSLLIERRAEGVEELDHADSVRFRAMAGDLEQANEAIEEYRHDLERSQIPERYQNLGNGGGSRRADRMNCRPGAQVMPLNFGLEQLRSAHNKVLAQESCRLETRATVSELVPGQLYPVPTFPMHEGRIADYLPAFALEAPSLEYIQVNSVTGTATTVAEGGLKPEVVLNTTKLVATAVKIAAHLGLSWETLQDFDAFTSSATTELQRQVVAVENAQILGWLATTGILTHAALNTPSFDDLEESISKLRTGSSLAVADLLIVSPATWSAIRREKDGMDRYYVAADPSVGEVSTVWGLPVVSTTACPDNEGWMLDTKIFGRLAVREPFTLRIGMAGDDFTRNIVRYVGEERCVLTVERPSAVLHLTNLGVPPVARSASKSKSDSK